MSKLEEVSKADRITDVDPANQNHPSDILVGMQIRTILQIYLDANKNFLMKEISDNTAIINSLKQLELIYFNTFEEGKCKLPLTDYVLKNSVFLKFFNRD